MKFKEKLFGFKTNNKLKNIVALIYYVVVFLLFVGTIFIAPDFKVGMFDLLLYKLSKFLIILIFILPPVFLSDFKFNLNIPFFKEKRPFYSLIGTILLVSILLGLSNVIDIMHTESYFQNQNGNNGIKYNDNTIYTSNDKTEVKDDVITDEVNEIDSSDKLNNEPITNKENDSKVDKKNEEIVAPNISDTEIKEGDISKESLSNLKVHFIDVGQGDSIFIELPNYETILIDAGTSSKSKVVSNYISLLGYTEIDYLIGTHPHADHIGGMASIVDSFDIGKIYMPKVSANTKTYENLLQTILDNGLSVKSAKAGVSILNSNDLNISIISPVSSSYNNLNNWSAVIKLQYLDKTFLFMGDAEELVENQLSDVDADVIKVGHHGSSSSSSKSFIEKVSADYAVISVGEGNQYDHPYASVIDDWKASGVKILRTDLDGTIVISSNGYNLVVE